MRQYRNAGLLVCALAAHAIADGVEYHSTTIVWERPGPHPTPWNFSAGPLPYFDTHNGARRLAQLRVVEFSKSWHSKVTIDNPWPICQCIEYTDYNVEARADIPIGGWLFIVQGPGRVNRLGAPPMTQVFAEQNSHVSGGSSFTTMKTDETVLEWVGMGSIPFEFRGAGSGYDTFGIGEAGCACIGGHAGASFTGFDEYYARFEFVLNVEYHWVDACAADLTTWSNPAQFPQHHYGVPDGFLDSHDFFYFLDQYAAGNLAVADLTTVAIPGLPGYGTPDGILSGDDFFYFLRKYVEGC